MIEMNDETAMKIMSDKTFDISAGDLAKQLSMSKDMASVELLHELALHRGVLQTVGSELTAHQKAHINYAKRDVVRREAKRLNKENEMFVPDTNDEGQSIIDLEMGSVNIADHTSFSKAEIERVIKVVPLVFSSRSVPNVIELLTVGEKEFKENHSEMSGSTFNRQIKNWEKQMKSDRVRNKLDGILFTDKELVEKKNRQLAMSFLDMVEQDTDKEWFDTWFKIIEDNEWFDEAFDFIEKPKNMMKHWDMNTQARKDGYEFVKELQYLLNE